MFKKLMFVGVIAATLLTQSVAYSEEATNSVNTVGVVDAVSADTANNTDAHIAENLLAIEKLIVSLEAKGYSHEQILEILNSKAMPNGSPWPEVTNHCIRNATIIALTAILVWAAKSGYSTYRIYRNERELRELAEWRALRELETRHRGHRDEEREDRSFPGSLWR